MSSRARSWYYVDKAGKTVGPKTTSELKPLYASKIITDKTYVWNGTTVETWTVLKKVPSIHRQLKPAQQTQSTTSGKNSESKLSRSRLFLNQLTSPKAFAGNNVSHQAHSKHSKHASSHGHAKTQSVAKGSRSAHRVPKPSKVKSDSAKSDTNPFSSDEQQQQQQQQQHMEDQQERETGPMAEQDKEQPPKKQPKVKGKGKGKDKQKGQKDKQKQEEERQASKNRKKEKDEDSDSLLFDIGSMLSTTAQPFVPTSANRRYKKTSSSSSKAALVPSSHHSHSRSSSVSSSKKMDRRASPASIPSPSPPREAVAMEISMPLHNVPNIDARKAATAAYHSAFSNQPQPQQQSRARGYPPSAQMRGGSINEEAFLRFHRGSGNNNNNNNNRDQNMRNMQQMRNNMNMSANNSMNMNANNRNMNANNANMNMNMNRNMNMMNAGAGANMNMNMNNMNVNHHSHDHQMHAGCFESMLRTQQQQRQQQQQQQQQMGPHPRSFYHAGGADDGTSFVSAMAQKLCRANNAQSRNTARAPPPPSRAPPPPPTINDTDTTAATASRSPSLTLEDEDVEMPFHVPPPANRIYGHRNHANDPYSRSRPTPMPAAYNNSNNNNSPYTSTTPPPPSSMDGHRLMSPKGFPIDLQSLGYYATQSGADQGGTAGRRNIGLPSELAPQNTLDNDIQQNLNAILNDESPRGNRPFVPSMMDGHRAHNQQRNTRNMNMSPNQMYRHMPNQGNNMMAPPNHRRNGSNRNRKNNAYPNDPSDIKLSQLF